MQVLTDLLPEIARLGDREAVRWSNGLRCWTATYHDLYACIAAVVSHFDRCGISKGECILLWADNRMEWLAVFWACVSRGILVVPVDHRFSPDLVGRIQAASKPTMVIDNAFLDKLAALPKVTRFEPSPITPDDIVEIVYTSGTTGEPKGVAHRHRNLCANLRPFQSEIAKYKKWARPFQPIRILNLLPLSHMFGQSMGLFIPLFLEGAVVFTTDDHPGRVMQTVCDHRVSVVVSVPRILENLRNEVERQFSPSPAVSGSGWIGVLKRWWRYRKIHSRLGWKFWAFVAGGARLDPELEEFWMRLGYLVIQGYGLTEASPVVAVNHPFNARRGSLGKVVAGQDVTIAPDGEILVRGESVTTTDGGWLHTGDLGEIDAEGRVYYRGRKKDMIVTPEGLNVHPEDVEATLRQFPEIRDSAVVGSRKNGGEHVHAALILKDPSADPQELIRKANQRLEAHQRIQTWSIWPDEDFPRTASTLKVKRHEVMRQLEAQPEKPQQTTIDLSAISSLERVELLSELENRYKVELDEEAFSKLTSTRELNEWLRQAGVAARPAETSPSDWARSFPIHCVRTIFQHAIALPLFRNLLTLTVTGLENLEGLAPAVIFAANHTSHLDAPAVFTALPYRWRQRLTPAIMQEQFRAFFEPHRSSWKEYAFAGFTYLLACTIYNTYPLPQQMSGARRALKYTGDLISRGYCPLVFPEGLRSKDGKIQPFRPGIGMMAVRLRVPVVPIRITGLYEIYSVHDSWPCLGPVHVSIGRPLDFPADMGYEEATRRLEEALRQLKVG